MAHLARVSPSQEKENRTTHVIVFIRVVSLFAGCGGSDLGATGGFKFLGNFYKRHPIEIVYANDIDKLCTETYMMNFRGHITCSDIREIPSKAIPDHDILIGGFPCQTFSIVGERKGLKDPRGQLYLEMARILRDKKPKAFIAENVKGLISVDNGKVIKLIIKEFKAAGYEVAFEVLNAADYGVPQKRERVIMVGIRKSLRKKYKFPEPTHSFSQIIEKKKWVALKRILEKDPDSKYTFTRRAVEGLKRSNMAFNKGRAQDTQLPCNTISAHLAKVSLNGTDPVLLINPEKPTYRRFTPREAARIQSFPDNFKFAGSDLAAYKQIGNAIPPVLMWYIVDSLLQQIPVFESIASSQQSKLISI